MSFDPRPYREAIRALNSTRPLGLEERQEYVARPDRLGTKMLNRVLEETGHPLLLSGPPGCGKSTELIWLQNQPMPFRCVLCPCDEDLDLTRVAIEDLYRYLIWRVLDSVPDLSSEITREAWGWVSTEMRLLANPRAHFANRPVEYSHVSLFSKNARSALDAMRPLPIAVLERDDNTKPATIRDTMARLFSEAQRHKPLLLVIDGLEKIPPGKRDLLLRFLSERFWEEIALVVVVPLYLLHGSGAVAVAEGLVILSVEFNLTTSTSWGRDVVERRTNGLILGESLELISAFSGGVVRDGLQLARMACRLAIDDERNVKKDDVWTAILELEAAYWALLGDHVEAAQHFLAAVYEKSRLPSDQALRDIVLFHGLVLNTRPGYYVIHPILQYGLRNAGVIPGVMP